ncbi:Arrestin [Coniochaeta hoffmannii]|uniref:Arrestin n=1 Tax=Coniochaeta hoffmannii TaxID=91930 RepID=A0AA38R9I4_9PEZI|nr:Arrestin [Coniochaeta hoffmannii]
MSSTASEASDLTSTYTRKMGFPKSTITVDLDNHFKQKVYTSGSPVSGHATITTQRDVRFDSVQIVLVGNSKTRVDGVNSPREVTHTFLKMTMPVPESSYPVPRVLENGRTYTIPFNFVIPNYLTMHACNHHILHDQLQDHHVLLPPSMGGWSKDDMAPEMAKVEYSVKARVFRQPDLGASKIKVMEGSQNIFVLPASAEQPPLNVTSCDKLYALSKSKTLRKSLLSGKLGRMTAEAIQPPAASLRADGHAISGTMAQVQLTFDPASADIVPPKITSVAAKVFAHTYYSAGAIASFPNMADWSRQFGAEKRGAYQTSVSLPNVTLGKTRWAQHLSSSIRRDSGYGSDEPSSPGEDDIGRRGSKSSSNRTSKSKPSSPIFHTTILQIPIDLNSMLAKKTPIPTFHSCITSRVYALQLTVTFSSGSSVNTLTLSLPLQIAVEPDSSLGYPGEDLPSFETAVQEAEVDEMMRPRYIYVPDQQYVGTSSLPGGLPGYGDAVTAH